jgi:hypothetical protein
MNRGIAEKLVDAANRIDLILAELDEVCRAIDDEAERKKIRHGIGDTISALYLGVTREVCLEYPDLHPDFPNGGWPGDPRKAGKSS